MLSLAPTVNSARIYVLPSKSRTPPRDDQDAELVLYPSYWFVSLLNLMDPSDAKPVGLSAEVPNVYRPITTLSTNPFTASNATAGTYYRAGGNITCSIFSSSLVSCTLGSEFEIIQTSSAGYVLFETGSGVTLNSKSGNLKLAGQFSAATLKKVGDNEWDLIGDLG